MTFVLRFAAVSVLAAASFGAAIAQDVRSASEGVVACQSLTDPMEKLACYEAAAAQVEQALAEPAQAPVAAPPAPAETAAVATVAPAASEPQPVQVASAAPAEEAPETAEKRRILPSWIPSVSLNFGSGEDRVKEPNEFTVSVTRIQRNRVGRHFFTTSDGHVWKQVEAEDIVALTKLPAGAEIRKAFAGAIRIHFDEDPKHGYGIVRVE